jgi:ATP-dependent helicase HrpB
VGTSENWLARVRPALDELVIGNDAWDFAADVGTDRFRAGVITAEPGAGKTTGVPLALAAQEWLHDSSAPGLVIAEPRRVAAKRAAERLASLLGQRVGQVVGLRMRGETVVSAQTRIEVVTDGVLARMLCSDPELSGRSCLVIDEFHERSLDTDIGLALALSAQELFRPDLRLVVMSATLDTESIVGLLRANPISSDSRDVRILHSPGRTFPVVQVAGPTSGPLEARVVTAVQETLAKEDSAGDILVFLAGRYEIERCKRALSRAIHRPDCVVLALHGRGDQAETRAALAPATHGKRRIILATSIAQTSITIDGISVVIDSGFVRRPRRDEGTGLTRLRTERISRATKVQRAGRAGRTRPGTAIRLWSPTEDAALVEHDPAELEIADLAPVVLTALRWGVQPHQLRLLSQPTDDRWAYAINELRVLGAVEAAGEAAGETLGLTGTDAYVLSLTEPGVAMAELPVEPRLASLLLRTAPSQRPIAAWLAAALSDSTTADISSVDIRDHLLAVLESPTPAVQRTVKQLQALLHWEAHATPDPTEVDRCGALLLHAYPERLAVRIPASEGGGDLRYRFASGLELPFAQPSDPGAPVASIVGTHLIVAVDVDADRRRGSIRLAAPVSLAEVSAWANAADPTVIGIVDRLDTVWDGPKPLGHRKTELRITSLGSPTSTLAVQSTSIAMSCDSLADAVLQRLALDPSIMRRGTARSRPTGSEQDREGTEAELLARLGVAAEAASDQWDHLDDETLRTLIVETVRQTPHPTRWTLNDLPVARAITLWLDRTGQRRAFDRFVPVVVQFQSGISRPVSYATDSGRPEVSVRLQDVFGVTSSPTVCDGRVPVTLTLLSPADRPLAVTDDLARFWTVGYPGVRSDLRGRYPKHQWPEDPRTAEPRRMNKPR